MKAVWSSICAGGDQARDGTALSVFSGEARFRLRFTPQLTLSGRAKKRLSLVSWYSHSLHGDSRHTIWGCLSLEAWDHVLNVAKDGYPLDCQSFVNQLPDAIQVSVKQLTWSSTETVIVQKTVRRRVPVYLRTRNTRSRTQLHDAGAGKSLAAPFILCRIPSTSTLLRFLHSG